ncbi:TetR/AcrR family transcriptional regulator [Salipaludibacillus agaradhaerens]|uniref:TetR/AcrR family transcriptional regulator n=1 Tax=Salipaludibacillus agaradhaerens TaxID=76935 RepID=A0A9Q4FZE0_SALAG|nr:TetR/AcrR family transcriptional regulator [Salipaludibacillus agaradhaerens]MCR6097321.1 TetR/AcrR family transcriptional regulator [Salipaludibacillus agaradhaerens]MCR6113194.1 TetR/AcrR family transcriptional regulator [Salipaludibacillus agaradhaerens]
MDINEDRRVRKTKKALRNGLVELMVNKDLRNITVRELTDNVDIHRATFYAHYKDIYDLYDQVEDAVVEELNDLIMQNYSQPPSHFYRILFEYIIENKQLCQMLFGTKRESSFMVRLNVLFEQKCIETWRKDWKLSEVNEELKYHVGYHVQGCLAIINRWVESNFTYPMDELVKIIADIDRNMEDYFMKKKNKI